MSKIVNLRRARKAKARTESAMQAHANRLKHARPKSEHNLTKVRNEKLARTVGAHKLDGNS